jgi:very-short-patch-repair endonuclease
MPNHYTLDFAHIERKIAFEIDGSSHFRAKRRASDERKDAFLKLNGWRVFRFPIEVTSSEVLRVYEEQCHA